MDIWPPTKIQKAVIASIDGCGGATPGNVGNENTVGDFFPGSTGLPASVKRCITNNIKARCRIKKFSWSGRLSTTLRELIDSVRFYQKYYPVDATS